VQIFLAFLSCDVGHQPTQPVDEQLAGFRRRKAGPPAWTRRAGEPTMLRKILSLPVLETGDLDGEKRLRVHQAVLRSKPVLRSVFQEFHRLFLRLDETYFGDTAGARVELGAGVAPVRDSFQDVRATDVVPAPHLDQTVDAMAMPLADGSVRAFYCQNCFHHFTDPGQFFREVRRVVRPGGGVILIEPYYGPAASLLYPRLFASESFDKKMPGWRAGNDGPMSGANQALSYIIFERDRARFAALFPDLRIVHARPLTNYPRYLLSGGLNFRQLVPDAANRPLQILEGLLAPLARLLALHHVLVIHRQ
jgi:SAM-dependent methyltransferase